MKLLSRIILLALFVVGIFIATDNMQIVEFSYIPDGDYSPLPQGAKLELPLFLLVLGSLLVGAFLAGFATAFEHARLRAGLRRQTRLADRARDEASLAKGDLEELTRELDTARTRAEQAVEREKTAVRAQEEAIAAVRAAEMRQLEAQADAEQNSSNPVSDDTDDD
ncbi:MAG: putative integral membrane protein [Hyphomicrobiaceae bacterium]|jgi:uncharacterized integral membrane protein